MEPLYTQPEIEPLTTSPETDLTTEDPPHEPGGIDPDEPPIPVVLGNQLVPAGDDWIETGYDGTPLGIWVWDNDEWTFKVSPSFIELPRTGGGTSLLPYILIFSFSLTSMWIGLHSRNAQKQKHPKIN